MIRKPSTRRRHAKGQAITAPLKARLLLRQIGREGLMPGERLLRDCALSTALWTIIAEHCEIEELCDGQSNAFLWIGDEGILARLEALFRREDDFVKRCINTRDRHGSTLLHTSVEAGRTEVVKLLLSSPDIDTELRDKNGKTALQLAAKRSKGIREMLERAGSWLPASERTSPHFQMAALRQCISLRGAVFPYGFGDTIRGVDIRDADLSRTRLTEFSLRYVTDFSGVRLPEACLRGMKEGKGVPLGVDSAGYPLPCEGGRSLRSCRKRIAYRKRTALAGGVILDSADLSQADCTWEELDRYAVFQGVVFPEGFDMAQMHSLGWKRFLYCDFSRCLNFPYDFHLRAGQALGLKFPPLDFREVHFEGVDLTDADFSAQIPPDWDEDLSGS